MLPLKSESVNLILADSDPGRQNVAESKDPDSTHAMS